jgi:hypothetical protein
MSEHQGIFYCDGFPTPIPTIAKIIGTDSSGWDGYTCVIPDYISNMPIDPKFGYFTDQTDYSSGYTIVADAEGRVTVSAPSEVDSSKTIAATR